MSGFSYEPYTVNGSEDGSVSVWCSNPSHAVDDGDLLEVGCTTAPEIIGAIRVHHAKYHVTVPALAPQDVRPALPEWMRSLAPGVHADFVPAPMDTPHKEES